MGGRTNGEVRVAKGFYTSAKERVFKAEVNGSLPDDTTDIKRVRTTDSDALGSFFNDVLSFLRKSLDL